jgi:MoaA/NifB/PqqE/SkfB family radical SAM enzyme
VAGPAAMPEDRCVSTPLPEVPERIDVKVGFACNNKCLFCVQGRKRERFGRRSYEELAGFLAEGRAQHRGVVFTGGEPTLHPDLVKLAARARELGYSSIQVQSNGRMFAYRKLCEELVAAGVNEFSPALHGHRPECHDHLTTVAGSFEQTVQGIRNLKALGQRVITNSVITRSNFRHLVELARLLVRLGVDQYQLAFVHPVGSAGMEANFASIVPRFELIMPHVQAALEVGDREGRRSMTEAIPYCCMQGYERFIGEKIMPPTRIFDAEGVIEDYRDYRLVEGKAKGEPCRECSLSAQCEGPWREYPERYGWGEFRPVSRQVDRSGVM